MTSPIKYVVVSTPRSATGWTSQVLTAMGLRCGHEKHFAPDRQVYGAELEADRTWGDSSWMAAPFIDKLPPFTMVLHQTRNPCDTIASMVALKHFDHWDKPSSPYHVFMHEHIVMDGRLDPIQLAAWFWYAWHVGIEERGQLRGWPWYARYRVESVDVGVMYRWIMSRHPTTDQLRKALEVPTDVNSKPGRHKPIVTMDMLPTRVVDLARRYGY